MLIILDVDGTLTQDLKSDRVYPEMRAYCHREVQAGHTLVLASNQGGVALEYRTLESTLRRIELIAAEVKAIDYLICTYHEYGKRSTGHAPEKHYSDSSTFRKPEGGMLVWLMTQHGFKPEETIYIGDRKSDKDAAMAAGVKFIWAQDVK